MAKERVKARVLRGGHSIPEEVIERRYFSGIKNFIHLHMKGTDYWMLIDNNESTPEIVAEGFDYIEFDIKNSDIWNTIQQQGNG